MSSDKERMTVSVNHFHVMITLGFKFFDLGEDVVDVFYVVGGVGWCFFMTNFQRFVVQCVAALCNVLGKPRHVYVVFSLISDNSTNETGFSRDLANAKHLARDRSVGRRRHDSTLKVRQQLDKRRHLFTFFITTKHFWKHLQFALNSIQGLLTVYLVH